LPPVLWQDGHSNRLQLKPFLARVLYIYARAGGPGQFSYQQGNRSNIAAVDGTRANR